MPIKSVQIPINLGANKDIEEVGLRTHNAAMTNFYRDINGNVVRTPGLVQLCNLGYPHPVDGLFSSDRLEIVLVACGGKIFKITDSTGTFSDITGDTLESGKKPYWADWGSSIYAANGGRIIEAQNAGNTAYIADADAPTTVTHIADLNKTLFALPADTEAVHYSESEAPENWTGSWITPVSSPDLTKFCGQASDILEVWGSSSMEGWRATGDASIPFIKDPGYTVPKGIGAPYSPVNIDGAWYFIDSERRVIRMGGDRNPQPISVTMNAYIQDTSIFTTVADARGEHASFNGQPIYVLHFPSADKTLAWDCWQQYWFELGRWDSGTSTYSSYGGLSFCQANFWNFSLVGDKTTGKVYKLISSNYQDDTNIHRGFLRTANLHMGHPGIRKKDLLWSIHFKKSNVAQQADAAQFSIRWRDDGKTTWGNWRNIDLGYIGETSFTQRLRNRGNLYYTRQYEIALSDNSPIVLCSFHVEFKY